MGSYYQVNEAGHDSYIEERVRRHEGNNRSIAKSGDNEANSGK